MSKPITGDAGAGKSHRHRKADIAKPDHGYLAPMRHADFPARPARALFTEGRLAGNTG